MVRFTKKADVAASAEKVWKIFAHDFDGAYKWMASVPHSYGKAVGEQFDQAHSAGRVCELNSDPKGLKASEQFLEYNEADKTCTVRIDFVNPPVVFPVRHNTLRFSVVETAENKSQMTWAFQSKIKPWAFLMWPLLRIGFGVFVGQIIEELVFYVENGTPHPRKLKALEKTKELTGA